MRKNNANMLLIGMIWGLILWASPVFSWSVPDTGQTGCYDADGTSITCPESGQPFAGQDGSYLINRPHTPSWMTVETSCRILLRHGSWFGIM